MFLRLAMAAPLALAAALPAQLTPTTPVKPTTPVAPTQEVPTQEPTPAERLEILKKEKERLHLEIKFATERVQQAKSLLSTKLQRGKPVFKSIDAGKPASAVPIAPPRVQRKYARIGNAEEMNFGGNTMMIMVNDRAISQASYDGVMDYLRESGNTGTEELRAQRVLFDLIRVEAVASQFLENEGEIKLSENLALLEDGTKSMAAAAAEFGSVAGAKEDGAVQVTRNSILGPYFEYVAFSTPVGKMSRPFRTTNGYALIKVDSVEKGAQTGLDKVLCHVVQFAYSPDQKVMQQAQFKVNSGQVDIRVRDQAVLDLLPALFKPPVARATPLQQAQQQIKQIETLLKELGDTDPEKAKILNEQLGKMRLRAKQLEQAQDTPDADQLVPAVKGKLDTVKRAPKK
tara:strand:- start:1944 stop:3146 length:1203 start_codon:yes stop_codon:yes gene_type:complete